MSPWRSLRCTVRGAAHLRTCLPNQDTIRDAAIKEAGIILVALADGHGSAKSFRSQYGARIAVSVVRSLFCTIATLQNLSQIKRWAEEYLPGELVKQWRRRVQRDLDRKPFTDCELGQLDDLSQNMIRSHPELAYGSTVIAILMAESYIIYLQLGDGDILVLSNEGEVSRPVEKDPRLIANETTSLCSHEAWKEIHVRFQALAGINPSLIMVSSDGYANAFRDDASFEQVAIDLWEILRDEGELAVRSQLRVWLTQASFEGSGDDISLGILWRPTTTIPT